MQAEPGTEPQITAETAAPAENAKIPETENVAVAATENVVPAVEADAPTS